jgi:hypothetical protein
MIEVIVLMKSKYLIIAVLLVLLLIVPVFLYYGFLAGTPVKGEPSGLFVGVDVAYDNVPEIKQLVDEISPYTNTIVIGSTGITFDMEKLDDVCQYVYDRGFYFMIYAHPVSDVEKLAIQRQWVLDAKPRWGQYFLGLYAYDEPGGRQLDNASLKAVHDEDWFADNWTEAADKYANTMFLYLNITIKDALGGIDLPLFTSDYALYWFDYKAHYDVVFAEFGWNYSRHINVALDRGAANIQNREWGVMITWTYTQSPYLESDKELYNDLVLAYENGAKYILVFDTNANYTHSILLHDKDRLNALKRFWRYATDNPRPSDPPTDRVAYVLPKDYGYGFRGPNDKIWGLWEADEYNNSLKISTEVGALLDEYQNRLDIIYDDGLATNSSYGYSRLIFWNGTVRFP